MLQLSVRSLLLSALISLGVLFCLGTFPTRAQSPEEAEVRAVVDRFFAALQKKDEEGLMALWDGKSHYSVLARDNFEPMFAAVDGIRLKSLVVGKVKVSADKASVRVNAEIAAVNARSRQPVQGFGQIEREIQLVREAGGWKVWRYLSAVEELATRIAAASTDEERQTLIEANKELVTIDLDKAISDEGSRLVSEGAYDQALGLLSLQEKLVTRFNDRAGKADLLRAYGYIHNHQHRSTQALEEYGKALEIYEELGDKWGTARVLHLIGMATFGKGNGMSEPLGYFMRSLGIYEEIGNKRRIAYSLSMIGIATFNQGKLAEAMDLYRRRLDILYQIGDKQGIADTVHNMALVQIEQGNYRDARKSYETDLSINQETGNKRGIDAALIGLGRVDQYEGNYSRALERYRAALRKYREAKDQGWTASLLREIGDVQLNQGDYVQALENLQESAKIYEGIGSKGMIAGILGSIGQIYYAQGDYSQALLYYERCAKMSEEVGRKNSLASTLNDLGIAHTDQGNHKKAMECYEKSLKIFEEMGAKSSVAAVLDSIGTDQTKQGNYTQAIEWYQKSLTIRKELGDKNGLAETQANLAETYTLEGEYAKAIDMAERAGAIASQINAPEFLINALFTAGKAYRSVGKLNEAREAFGRAIAAIETMRDQVAGAEQERERFLEIKLAPYHAMVDMLIDESKPAEALAFAERARARALLDALRSGRANITTAESHEERQQEQEVDSQLVSLNAQIVAEKLRKEPDQNLLADLNSRRDKARLEHAGFQTRLYAAHPELRIKRVEFEPLTLQQCRELLPDANTALLEFVVLPHRTILFVIAGKGAPFDAPAVKTYSIAIKEKDLTELCERFRQQLANRHVAQDELARKLYDLLIKEAAADLGKKSNFIVIPDGGLWELPFQALKSGPNRFMIEDRSICYAPSLTALREMSKLRRSKDTGTKPTTMLALGSGVVRSETSARIKQVFMDADLQPLPQAEEQVEAISQLYGPAQARFYIGPDATEDRLKAEAGSCRILHIAAHGIVNNASPMYSQILLSKAEGSEDDGILEAWEILNMDFNADLVVLSACETARGRVGAGEGVIGLSWAFFVAGCPATVVSQWKVEAESTTRLMVEFHRNLLAGMRKSEAIRRAELKLMRTPKYADPFYWAGFVVIGNPEPPRLSVASR